jgi:hypothetical protein
MSARSQDSVTAPDALVFDVSDPKHAEGVATVAAMDDDDTDFVSFATAIAEDIDHVWNTT